MKRYLLHICLLYIPPHLPSLILREGSVRAHARSRERILRKNFTKTTNLNRELGVSSSWTSRGPLCKLKLDFDPQKRMRRKNSYFRSVHCLQNKGWKTKIYSLRSSKPLTSSVVIGRVNGWNSSFSSIHL